MFERHKEKRAAADYQAALARWQHERDGEAAAVAFAQSYTGETASELMLHSGEAAFATITDAALVEERRGRGQWQGGSSGVSVPIGSLGGRSIRYHVGASRGHYVQGTPHPTAVDTGTVYITDQRVVFQGHAQTRECLFAKLLACEASEDGSTTFSVSNRQKPTTIHYGPQLNGWVQLRLDLALAHYRHEVPALVERLQHELATIDAAKPVPPAAG
jgi:hypothetical protein